MNGVLQWEDQRRVRTWVETFAKDDVTANANGDATANATTTRRRTVARAV
jgi:hypothetical protein